MGWDTIIVMLGFSITSLAWLKLLVRLEMCTE